MKSIIGGLIGIAPLIIINIIFNLDSTAYWIGTGMGAWGMIVGQYIEAARNNEK